MNKKQPKPDIKSIILKRQNKQTKEESSESEDLKALNINVESYESSSDAEDLEDYKVDGYHPVTLGEVFCNGKYTIIQKLGWGHFSTVWLVQEKDTNLYYAMKIQKSKKSYGESAIDELELLRDMEKHANDQAWIQFCQQLNASLQDQTFFQKLTIEAKHLARKDSDDEGDDQGIPEDVQSFEITPNTQNYIADPAETYSVKLLNNFAHFGTHGKHYCSVFDVQGPTLLDLITHFDKYDRFMASWLVKLITRQILIGLVYMHDVCNVIHTDIKPENIMIQLKPSYLNEFIEDIKKYKKKPTSMKFLAIQQAKNANKKNKKKKKKKNNAANNNQTQAQKIQAEPVKQVDKQSQQPVETIQPPQEVLTVEATPVEVIPVEVTQTEQQPELQPPQSQTNDSQLNTTQAETETNGNESKTIEQNQTTKKKEKKKKPLPQQRFAEDAAENENDDDFEDVSSRSRSVSRTDSSETVPEVDDETLYTLKWKEHILIKLDKELKIKIVDFGNACWTHKQFTDNIQTREYRAPEVILQAEYQANTDIWSLACMVFELLTNNYLFKPKKGPGFGKSDDHLALMIETLGKMNKNIALGGKRSREFFNKNGQLIRVKDLRKMPIHELLFHEYDFSEKEALSVESFLMPMLDYDPKKRISARDALRHPWLWSDD